MITTWDIQDGQTVLQGQSVQLADVTPGLYINYGGVLTNFGIVAVTGPAPTLTGIDGSSRYASGEFDNEAGGVFSVSGGVYQSFGVLFLETLVNDGQMFVTSAGDAEGVRLCSLTPTVGTEFTNSGLLQVTGGVTAMGALLLSGGSLENSGTIDVIGASSAVGVDINVSVAINFVPLPSELSISNSGTILAHTNAGGESVGVAVDSDPLVVVTLFNSGTITGDYAVMVSSSFSPPWSETTVVNSGTLDGIVHLGEGADVVNNSGLIAGDIQFGAGDDLYNGASGQATGAIYGGAGDDVLHGGGGNETLDGGAGDDLIDGGQGIDTAGYADAAAAVGVDLNDQGVSQNTGGAGSDTLIAIENLTGSAFNDSLTGDGNDNVIHGGDGGDTLRGGAGADQLFGDNGDDVLIGAAGNDVLDGGPGHDYVVYSDAPSAVAVDLEAGTASGGDGVDALTSIEGVYGAAFNDNLQGDANRNDIHGGDGGDTIVGNAGDDVLYGEGGDDVLLGGPGDDILDGGAGRNYTSYSDAPSAVAIDLNITNSYQGTGGAGSDWLINIQDVFGSAFNDTIVGDGANNHLFGWTGGDSLSGGGGADDITGGAGADVLTGGTGNDTFYYDDLSDSTVAAPDLITDFSPGDRIYLAGIDADSVTPGDQAFHVGATPGHTGDLVVSYDGVHDKTTLWLYVDADATPDGRITLLGDHSAMTAADFGP